MGALATTMGQKRHMHYDRILVTKPPVSINRNLYTGYKPGTSEEKLSGHLAGFKSNLKFLLDGKDRKSLKPGESEESKSDLVWTDLFEVVEIDEIQGASIHHTIFLIDEWQLLDEESTKLVASRISEGAKMVLIGDTQGQTYGMNRANEGFKVLFKHLGERPEMSFIKLENIYRSPLAKFVDEVFE
jgi:PhoH-like ATPase